MAWQWRYEDASGSVIEQAAELDAGNRFSSQADAESWLGENWRALLDAGVHQVTLLEEEREVYGPMGLAADD
ncbi:MAG: hypothetical protein ACRDMV_06550 [Streptosporangiales bacterium]